MEELFKAFPDIIYIIPIFLFGMAILCAVILAYSDTRRVRREKIEQNAIHYVERIINNKYITSCGKELDIRDECKNVIQFIPKVTCRECLKRIT